MKKLSILLLHLFIGITALVAQQDSFYVFLPDASGIDRTAALSRLETAAKAIAETFPDTDIQNKFQVFDAGMYLLNEKMEGGAEAAFEKLKATAATTSPYYLLFAKESNPFGLYDQFWVDMKMPDVNLYPCFEEILMGELTKLIQKEARNVHLANDKDPFKFYQVELKAMEKLQRYLDRYINCCGVTEPTSECSLCPLETEDEVAVLEGRDMLEFTGENMSFNITRKAYSHPDMVAEFSIEITNTYGEDTYEWSFTDELEQLLNDIDGAKARVLYFNETNCDKFDDYLNGTYPEPESAGRNDPDTSFFEEVIILDRGGEVRVFFKFTESDQLEESIIWSMKHLAIGKRGGLIHLATCLECEKCFSENSDYKSTWKNSEIFNTNYDFLKGSWEAATGMLGRFGWSYPFAKAWADKLLLGSNARSTLTMNDLQNTAIENKVGELTRLSDLINKIGTVYGIDSPSEKFEGCYYSFLGDMDRIFRTLVKLGSTSAAYCELCDQATESNPYHFQVGFNQYVKCIFTYINESGGITTGDVVRENSNGEDMLIKFGFELPEFDRFTIKFPEGTSEPVICQATETYPSNFCTSTTVYLEDISESYEKDLLKCGFGIVNNLTEYQLDINRLTKLFSGENHINDPVGGLRHNYKAYFFITDDQEGINSVENFSPPEGYDKIWLHLDDGKIEWRGKSLKELLGPNYLELNQALSKLNESPYVFDVNDYLNNVTQNLPNPSALRSGIANSRNGQSLTDCLDAVATGSYELLDWVSKGIKKAKIPDYVWNCESTKYDPFYSSVYRYTTIIAQPIRNLVEDALNNNFFNGTTNIELHKVELAALCGTWNGIIDLIASVVDVFALIPKVMSVQGRDTLVKQYNQLKEYKRTDENGKVILDGDGNPVAEGIFAAIGDGLGKFFDPSKPCSFVHNTIGITVQFAIVLINPAAVASATGSLILRSIQTVVAIADRFDIIGRVLQIGIKGVTILGQGGKALIKTIGDKIYFYVKKSDDAIERRVVNQDEFDHKNVIEEEGKTKYKDEDGQKREIVPKYPNVIEFLKRLDELGLKKLETKFLEISPEELLVQFADDFVKAIDDDLKILDDNIGLVDTWKNNKVNIKSLARKNVKALSIIQRIDKKGFLELRNKILGFVDELDITNFAKKFEEISPWGLKQLNDGKLHLVDFWRSNKKRLENYHNLDLHNKTPWPTSASLPNGPKKELVETLENLGTIKNIEGLNKVDDIHNDAIARKLTPQDPTEFDRSIFAAAIIKIDGVKEVIIRFNQKRALGKKIENSEPAYKSVIDNLHSGLKIEKDLIEYLDFLRKDLVGSHPVGDNVFGGKAFENVYDNHVLKPGTKRKYINDKVTGAQRPGIHAEVLLADAIMRRLNLKTLDELVDQGIKIMVKGDGFLGHMATCPHCHNILKAKADIVINK